MIWLGTNDIALFYISRCSRLGLLLFLNQFCVNYWHSKSCNVVDVWLLYKKSSKIICKITKPKLFRSQDRSGKVSNSTWICNLILFLETLVSLILNRFSEAAYTFFMIVLRPTHVLNSFMSKIYIRLIDHNNMLMLKCRQFLYSVKLDDEGP